MKMLKKLFLDGLAEIYDAETRLAWSLPQMVASASCAHLQNSMAANLLETQEHVVKLEGIFDTLGERASRKTNETTIALLNESREIVSAFKGFPVINAALIAVVQKIEHYEIASYGCLRDWAAILGEKEVARVLQVILDEDKATNQSLTELARTRSNQEALNEEPTKNMDLPADPIVPRQTPAISNTNGHTPGVRSEVVAAIHVAAESQTVRKPTKVREPSYEKEHRFVD